MQEALAGGSVAEPPLGPCVTHVGYRSMYTKSAPRINCVKIVHTSKNEDTQSRLFVPATLLASQLQKMLKYTFDHTLLKRRYPV